MDSKNGLWPFLCLSASLWEKVSPCGRKPAPSVEKPLVTYLHSPITGSAAKVPDYRKEPGLGMAVVKSLRT